MIYSSIGQSHIEYGLTIWYSKNKMKKTLSLQKKLFRTIHNQRYNAHTQTLFAKSRCLNIQDLFTFKVLRLVKKNRTWKSSTKNNMYRSCHLLSPFDPADNQTTSLTMDRQEESSTTYLPSGTCKPKLQNKETQHKRPF